MGGHIMLTDWRINVVKVPTQPKAAYRFTAIPAEIPTTIPPELEQITKTGTETQETPKSQNNLEKEKQIYEVSQFSDLKPYYKATVIQTIWYWHKNRHIYQCNSTEPRDKPILITNLWQRSQKYTEVKKVFSINIVKKLGQLHVKKKEQEQYLPPYTKINSKWI